MGGGSRSHSPVLPSESPTSSHFHASANRSTHSFASQSRSELTRSHSPARSAHQAAPFEGKFESARAAPKPPTRSDTKKTPRPGRLSTAGEEADQLSALPQRSGSRLGHPGSEPDTGKTSNVRRNSSLIKRFKSTTSRPQGSSSAREADTTGTTKPDRGMTLELADLFRKAGESPRTSRVAADLTKSPKRKPSKLVKKSVISTFNEVLNGAKSLSDQVHATAHMQQTAGCPIRRLLTPPTRLAKPTTNES
jgi:hypothetical protein